MAQEACGNWVCLIRRVPHLSEHCLPWPLDRLPLKVHVPLLELFTGFTTACFAHWLVSMGVSSPGPALNARLTALTPAVLAYLKGFGRLASLGLLLWLWLWLWLSVSVSVSVLMIHHGQEKLADPQQFANTYVASLHLPFPSSLPMQQVSRS